MNILVLMCGIPASGKSTAINKFFPDATVVSPDSYIGYTRENPWTPGAARRAWSIADEELTCALKRRDSVIIFDATFVKPKRRKKYIRLGEKFGFDVMAFCCVIPIKIAQDRNHKREEFRKVPDNTIKNMNKNFVAPSLDEGFKKILTFDSLENKLEENLSKFEKEFLGIKRRKYGRKDN